MGHPLPSLKSAASGGVVGFGPGGARKLPLSRSIWTRHVAGWNRHEPSSGEKGASRAPSSTEPESIASADRLARPEGPRRHRMLGTFSRHPQATPKKKAKSRPVSRVLSRTVIHLGQASPLASSGLPGCSAGNAIAPLFGLASGGVCRAVPVASHAVRSYRTFSPLPVPPWKRPSAVCSLRHFP